MRNVQTVGPLARVLARELERDWDLAERLSGGVEPDRASAWLALAVETTARHALDPKLAASVIQAFVASKQDEAQIRATGN